ncbi:hypothetical protein [Aeromonas phage AS-szw]|uniref:Uncharacterized protein n=1 Tax=Aeromonas phage AS-szw TaxID=2026114 RepID=A0A291LD17_9CAUD|nr:hypothetical protein [Aeromonas phage AS-szw]
MKDILDYPVGTPGSEVEKHMLVAHERRCMETIEISFGDESSFYDYISGKKPEDWAEDFRNRYEEVTGFSFPRNIRFGE